MSGICDRERGRPANGRMIHIVRLFLLIALILPPWGGTAANLGARHMIVIGIDGLSVDGLTKADTPALRMLMKQGAYSLKARAVMPTSSSPNWASMIMGAGPELHGVTSNDWMPDKFDVPPKVVGSGGIFPTIFGVMREQRPQFNIAVFHDWKDFGRLLETNAPNQLKHVKDAIETAAEGIKYWQQHQPQFLFLHFDGVDHAGHSFGWTSRQYYKEVEMVDSLVAAVMDAISTSGKSNETVVLVTADHGGIGKKHGGNTANEILIPWILNGPGIREGLELKAEINTYDTAPTIARIFDLKTPECWVGKPVISAFKDVARSDNNSP